MNDAFVPYIDRPALDKGPVIGWRDLESGMLFEPGVSAPARRRVRGTPQPIDNGYLIGSEDVTTGDPKGGIMGADTDVYDRVYDSEGHAVYVVRF